MNQILLNFFSKIFILSREVEVVVIALMRVTGNLKLKLNLPAENRQDLADRENDLLSSRLVLAN